MITTLAEWIGLTVFLWILRSVLGQAVNRVQRKFVMDALDQEHKLSEWEAQFINDLADLDERDPEKNLTDKQNDILNRIQRKLD